MISAPDSRHSARTWLPYAGLAALTLILVLQKTKYAMLYARQTPVLWAAELAVLASTLLLRSGLWRDSGWREEQARLGTLANNFYPPRRDALVNGVAVGTGVLAGLWWGLATWGAVLGGMRRGVMANGLADFEVATLAGVIAGGSVGAAIGLGIGHVWERRHRRQRADQRVAHAADGA